MKGKLVLIVLLLVAGEAFAQNTNPLRFEIATPDGTNPINYVATSKNGICVFFPTKSEAGKDSISWTFTVLNDQLKETWHKQVPLHKDVAFLKSVATEQAIYLLFHDTKRNKDGNIFVFMVVPWLQVITEHRGMIPDKAEVVDFEIANAYAFIGYNSRKEPSGIMAFSLMSGEKRNYAITSEKDALLLDIAIDSARADIYATYKVQYSSIRNHIFVNKYNSIGGLENTFDFGEQNERKNFNSAQYIPMGNRAGLLAGTYGYNVASTRRQYDYYDNYYNSYYNNYYAFNNPRLLDYDANQDRTPVSDGYFTAKVDNGVAGKIKYYNFSKFTNAFKYITDANAMRLKFKSEKKNENHADGEQSESGNDNDRSLYLRLIAHEIRSNGHLFVMTSEAYSPEYHTNIQMSYDYYGRSFPTTTQVFDGYRYSHAFVAGFDSAGNMAWNNGMEMRDIITKYLNRKLNCNFEDDESILFYNANNKIAFKTINGSAVVENTAYAPVPLKRGTDKPMDEYLGSIEHWYGDYFVATGYQNIHNNYLENSKRTVFYICKMAFR